MSVRLFSLFAVALLGLAHAAPAPFRNSEEPPPVELSGPLPDPSRAGGPAQLIVTPEAYRRLAREWGIASPPRINFRTHFLLASTFSGTAGLRYVQQGADLRGVPLIQPGLKCGLSALMPPTYQLRSFRRSEVKTVDGAPVPRP